MRTSNVAAILAALIPAALLNATSAWAVSQDINLTAVVQPACTISDSASPSAIAQNVAVTPQGTVVQSTSNFTFPITCNTPARLQISNVSGAMMGPQASSQYAARIDYIVNTTGLFPPITMNTIVPAAPPPDGSPLYSSVSSEASNGTLSVSITPQPATGPLAAGTYTDTVRLTITPIQ